MCFIDEIYSRRQIQEMLGGGSVIFLPNKNGIVTCACLDPNLNICNIDNQLRILVAEGKGTRRAANLLINEPNKSTPIRIFIKRDVAAFQYIGKFVVTEYTENIKEINLFCDDLKLEHNRIMAILMTKISD
ncbi:MAG: hypothetical protein AABZ74_13195 [Cyanobacteriota bacterium]